jgi:PAS domain S-box-containing protein
VNDKACEIAGYPRQEFLRLGLQDITHPDDFQAQLAQIRAILDGQIETYSMEKRYRRKDGSLIWVNVTASAVRDAHGELDYFVHVVEDISARKAAETALQELNLTLERRIEARTREIERMAEENRRAAIIRERLRMARDLHDTLANAIVGLLLQIRAVRKQLTQKDPTTLEPELTCAEESAREALTQVRTVVQELRYRPIGEGGLGPALERLTARLRAKTSLEITLHVDPAAAGLEDETAEVLYRIAEEAVHNVERHSAAEHVDVSVRVDRLNGAGCLTLAVADDGVGFDPGAVPVGHYGLLGMREQAELIGAELRVDSAPGQGTRVSVSVPA